MGWGCGKVLITGVSRERARHLRRAWAVRLRPSFTRVYGVPRAGPKVFDLRRSLTEVYQDMVDSFVVMPSGPLRWSGGF